jgi:hypothetical protein
MIISFEERKEKVPTASALGKRNEAMRVAKWRNGVWEHGVKPKRGTNEDERNARDVCELSEGESPKRDPGGERGRPMQYAQGLGACF